MMPAGSLAGLRVVELAGIGPRAHACMLLADHGANVVRMVDGVAVLSQLLWAMRGAGSWQSGRERNLLDGSHPFHDTYRCADGRHVAVGAIEPAFFRDLLTGAGRHRPGRAVGPGDLAGAALLADRAVRDTQPR